LPPNHALLRTAVAAWPLPLLHPVWAATELASPTGAVTNPLVCWLRSMDALRHVIGCAA